MTNLKLTSSGSLVLGSNNLAAALIVISLPIVFYKIQNLKLHF